MRRDATEDINISSGEVRRYVIIITRIRDEKARGFVVTNEHDASEFFFAQILHDGSSECFLIPSFIISVEVERKKSLARGVQVVRDEFGQPREEKINDR